jgi:SAM-dependent methyltransferase
MCSMTLGMTPSSNGFALSKRCSTRAPSARLLTAGLRPGLRCLEIGAGAGSIAAWISETVGSSGRVAAVDINARFLADLKSTNIDVYKADVRSVGLKSASFDLAHARFVFIHLPQWPVALEATLTLLKPAGCLVLEEPDFAASRALAGPKSLRQAFERVHRAIHAMFADRGMDFAFGSRLPAIMQDERLEAIVLENDAPIVRGGSAFAKMMGMSATQLQGKYVATGEATEQDIERYGAFAADPSCWAIYHGTVRATGTKPRAAGAV